MLGRNFGAKTKSFLLFIILFAVVWLLLFPSNKYFFSVDTISYISIAESYAAGDFHSAVNAYWSPLYSIILVPFIWLGIEGFIAVKLLSFILAVANYFAIRKLAFHFIREVKFYYLLSILLVPVLIYISYWIYTPDSLLLLFSLIYFKYLLDGDLNNNKKKYALAGFAASVAFLSKSYFLPFFFLHFTVINIIYYFKRSYSLKLILQNYLLGIIAFLILTSVWVGVLYWKYDEVMFSSTGKAAMSLISPEANFKHIGLENLSAPPHKHSYNSWEDPTYYDQIKWSPLDSPNDFIYFLKNMIKNLRELLLFATAFSPLFVPLILFAFLKKIKFGFKFWLSLLTVILYASGYLMTLVETRYLYFVYIILILLSIQLLESTLDKIKSGKIKIALITLIFLVTLLFPVKALTLRIGQNSSEYKTAEIISQNFNISNKNLASNGNWTESVIISFFTKSRYFSAEEKSLFSRDFYEELKNYNIQYFFDWQNSEFNSEYFQVLLKTKFDDGYLSVLKLKY